MAGLTAEYTPFETGLVDARTPLLPADEIRRIRGQVTCHGVAIYQDAVVFRIPADQQQRFAELLANPPVREGDAVVALYYDFNTPFGYTSTVIADRIEREYRARFDWRGFELFPDWRPLLQVDIGIVRERWKRNRLIPLKYDLPVADRRPMYRRTRNAMAALEFAKLMGQQRPLRDALFRAAWVDDRDIEDPSILKDIAIEVGVDGLAVEAAVVSKQFDALLDQYRQMAIEAGVFGAPSFVIGRQLVWARDPYELIVEALEREGVAKR
ncbi:MAG: DsbA family protein [Chloroflexi bacterium]|nr:DsbA family protein [Chloroflexota bacterium]